MASMLDSFKRLERSFCANTDNGALIERFKRAKIKSEAGTMAFNILDHATNFADPLTKFSKFVFNKSYKILSDE
jgi:hypothetical protein